MTEGLPEMCRCGHDMVLLAGRNQRMSAYCPHCDRGCDHTRHGCVPCAKQHKGDVR